MKATIKNKEMYVAKLEEAESLLRKVKHILSWDLPTEFEVEIKTAEPDNADPAEED